ncbi:MAG: pyridine nucleotide-disulfide oxidoreductase [Tatlockia sp.]|nr:pyridine nucleotide-disulfide oxidoreductase [Tatlockia sp.]
MTKIYQWTVVGAGPAGIAAIGKLLDLGISGTDLLWVDPQFKVGDLGSLWKNVSSNTKVRRFVDFLNAAESFNFQNADRDFRLNHLDPEETCCLSDVDDALNWVSKQLMQKVNSEKALIQQISLSQRRWCLQTDSQCYYSYNVILATGAVPRFLDYSSAELIPFEIAIDKERLSSEIDNSQTYALFGSSHSAIIILRHLIDLDVKKVINFYRSPCRYAIELNQWILFDNTGLKGQTAEWARENIDGQLPDNLVRYKSSQANITQYLPECNKIIYAVGFEKRNNIAIDGYENSHYNPHVGIIAPGLFGLGIAYPQLKSDPFGNFELQVGLWKFMTYLNEVMPTWLKYHS